MPAPRPSWRARLVEALTHQHDHNTVVERAIASANGERYRVTVRRCRCGDRAQTVERATITRTAE